MPLVTYVLLTLAGSAIWAFALAGAGWAAGTRYGAIHHDWRYAELAVALGVVIAAGFVVKRVVTPRSDP